MVFPFVKSANPTCPIPDAGSPCEKTAIAPYRNFVGKAHVDHDRAAALCVPL
jgi:hypothetical protein